MELSMEKNDDLIKMYDEKNDVWRFVKRDKGFNSQLMAIEDTLSKFGLLRNEIRVYLYLARMGERKASEIAEAISLHRTETYRILRDLEKKGVVFSAFEKPLKFTAAPLERAIDLLIEAQRMKIKLLEKEKNSLVQLWLSMPQPRVENNKKEIFQILEGEHQIILKADELLGRTREEMRIFAPEEHLALLYHSDFTDSLKRYLNKIDIVLITESSLKSRFFIERMDLPDHKYRMVDVMNLPCFIISDRKELLITIQENDEDKKKTKILALWTNQNAFVEVLQVLFSKLFETGKTLQEICIKSHA
ncbi:MAG TPA: helix-turn-helix domain-containing protein [Candidatus Bathyarchaeia archaeon]